MTLPQKTNKALVTNPPKMETYNLPDKEFKLIILKKPNEVKTKNQTKTREII